MRKQVAIVLAVAGILLIGYTAFAQDPIPADKEYTVKMAVYSLALDYIGTIGTTPANMTEYVNLMLARAIVRSPGQLHIVLAEFAQSSRPGGDVNWSAVTFGTAKTTIDVIWNDVAYQRFGPEPTQP